MSKSLNIDGLGTVQGRINVSGAKNSATRILAAALITDEKVILKNFPTGLVDANHKKNFINDAGGKVVFDDANSTVTVDASELSNFEGNNVDFEIPIRTTYLLAAGMLKRSKKVKIPYPGGCKIGSRGYDLHIMVWEKFGCSVLQQPDGILIESNGLKPCNIDFPISTIGGTENALICASSINGETIIKNAYVSPEVEDLIFFLRSMGVKIELTGNSFIRVNGSEKLGGSNYSIMPDRIEALTWIILAIISKGNILVNDVPFSSMQIPLLHLEEAGVSIFKNAKNAIANKDCIVETHIQPFEVSCGTHPGIISDMQPFYTLLALKADGVSRIYDYRYPERMKYLEELAKFCPKGTLEWEPGKITVRGPVDLTAAEVTSTDLRGSMALVMAGIIAKGTSTIHDVEMAMRGYNNLVDKLTSLGIPTSVKHV